MFLYEAAVAGGAEFDGLAAATGLLNFAVTGGGSPGYNFGQADIEIAPVVHKIVCTADNVAIVWTVETFRVGGGAEDLARIVNAQNVQFIDLSGCRQVMIDPANPPGVWALRVISSGNTGDASVFIQWRPERV